MLLEASLARMRRTFAAHTRSKPSDVSSTVVTDEVTAPLSCATAATDAVVPIAPVNLIISSSLDTSRNQKSVKSDAQLSEAVRRRRARKSVRDNTTIRIPRMSRPSRIVLNAADLSNVLCHIPKRFSGRDLKAVFSTMVNGVSLNTLYASIAGSDPVLLLVRDGGGATFGVYTSIPFHAGIHYHGSGEGFVFAIQPKVMVYPWTRKNSFFQLGCTDSIAVGGGGSFALFLDGMLEHGSSGESDTYGNKCLASTNQFDVVVVEAYKLVVPSRMSVDE